MFALQYDSTQPQEPYTWLVVGSDDGKVVDRLSGGPKPSLVWDATRQQALFWGPASAEDTSPLLAWREPVYIAAGLAGIVGMVLMLLQPLLAGGYLPGLSTYKGRRVHRWIGAVLVLAVVGHVIGLWITSPPDVIDALLFASPTPFSDWGVIGMWAVFGAALLAATRHRFRQRLRWWRIGHTTLVTIAVTCSITHAMLIEGTMEVLTKTILCAAVFAATVKTVAGLRVWAAPKRRGP